MDIWQQCRERIVTATLKGDAIRVVESQEQIATNHLVDNLQEQELLEQLLEQTKPGQAPAGLHYLLHTPFRYPPLPHGSRFGSRTEPSLLYASQQLTSALAETAYYRLLFWHGMVSAPASDKFTTQHTVFRFSYKTSNGLQLQHEPFVSYSAHISHPAQYQDSQQLGTQMRAADIEAFEYLSARDPDRGINVALFSPRPLTRKKPLSVQAWLCETRAQQVDFFSSADGQVYRYPLEIFLVNGQLPAPAV